MEHGNIFYDGHEIFWQNRSTIHAITELTGKNDEERKLIDVLYIGLSKVYNTINDILLLLDWVCSHLTSRKECVNCKLEAGSCKSNYNCVSV